MARFQPAIDVIDDLCLRSGDIQRRKKGLYLSVAVDVWNDLNETTLRIAKRLKIPVRRDMILNKRTRTIDLPCNANRLSSVNVVDECGVIHPVYRNLSIHDDIVEVPPEKNCACENNCGYKLCNLIKGYVAVQTVKTSTLPNGSPISFNCVDRICVGKNGIVYKETQYPQAEYTNGVWTNTILFTGSKTLCECETDDKGCICDTESNLDLLCESCGIRHFNGNNGPKECFGGTAMTPPDPNCNEWIYFCDSKMDWFTIQCGCETRSIRRKMNNVYNISENGKRLVFPKDFGFDKALVRFYEDISLNELLIPYIAKQTYHAGLMAFSYEMNPELFQQGEAYANKYSRYKWGLFQELNKMRIAELGNTISAPSYIPSYLSNERRYY